MSVAGHDKEAKKQMAASGITRRPEDDLNCIGVECFKLSFIMTAATLISAIVSLILVLRTRKCNKSDIHQRFREAAAKSAADKGEMEQYNDGRQKGRSPIIGF